MRGRLVRTSGGRPTAAVLAATTLVALAAFVLTVGVGEYPVAPGQVVAALLGGGDPSSSFIVTDLRLPRAVLAFVVGVALGVAGAVLQGLTRNPLAAPELVGVAAGANAAAVCVIVAFPGVPIGVLPVVAFVGAAVASGLVAALAGRDDPAGGRLLLCGVAVTTVATAVVLGAISTVDELIHASQLVTFLAGSVYGRGWNELLAVGPPIGVLTLVAFASARRLDTIGLGPDLATALGVRLDRTRAALLLLCAGLAGAAVAVAGPVGFVGLMAPHAARRLVGPRHVVMLPVCALVGGTTMLCADAVARTIFAPVDIPVGVVTAVVGAPVLIWLLGRRDPR